MATNSSFFAKNENTKKMGAIVDTPLAAGSNSTSKITPEKGCTSSLKCIFEDVISGAYYGSDGLRSPMTIGRDPGTPEYQGEANPDPAKYTR